MRAAVLRSFEQPLDLAEVEEPKPGRDDVTIRVRAVGLCGTDLTIISGALPGVQLPLIPGHEVAGEIVSESEELAPGQRVACYLYDPCGRCSWCARGQHTLCPNSRRIGFERDGGLADFIVVPRANALPFGEHLSFDQAAVSMDAVMSPWRALMVRAGLRHGERVAVTGAGGLGLNAVQIARLAGARVTAIDPIESHRELAKHLGAELAVSPEESMTVVEWSEGGVDVAFEGSGTRAGFDTALSCLRPGGRLACCGYRPGLEFALDSAELVLKEVTLLGSRAGSRDDARAALKAVEEGLVRPIIPETLQLGEVNSALDRLRRGEILGRVVIRL